MKLLLTVALALGVLVLPASANAQGRAARCVVSGNGAPAYRGPCRFIAERGGSFSVAPQGAKSFPGGVTSVSVFVTETGVAEVRGLTARGVNSRWGTAVRSRRDRACWEGPDFSVCAY